MPRWKKPLCKEGKKIWLRGVLVITTAQLLSTKPELGLCAGSNPARGVSEIWDGEDLWQWSQLEIRLNVFPRSTIPQSQFIIIIIIIIIIMFLKTKIARIEIFTIHHTFHVHRKLTSWIKIDKLQFFPVPTVLEAAAEALSLLAVYLFN